MTAALPLLASLEHLKNQAKSLLKTHDEGKPDACETLRHVHRLSRKSDAAILAAPVQLQEAQHAIALEYGFKSWVELKQEVESRERREAEERQEWAEVLPGQVRPESLARFALRTIDLPEDIPYLRAGVPSAVVQLLKHKGESVDFAEVTAAGGWAFSFSYAYGDSHIGALSVEDFAFLPERLGYEREAVSCGAREALWSFVCRNVDAGVPMVCTHYDGGLVYGYRMKDGVRQMWFDGTVAMGWTDITSPHPMDSCQTLVKKGEPRQEAEILREALGIALQKASPGGVAALEAYAADVEDPGKDFAESSAFWFCWAAFERLSARWCCARWLRSAAGVLPEAHGHLLSAAEHYERAFQLYGDYRKEVHAGAPTGLSLHERARTPERIAAISPILRKAIDAERSGIAELQKAVAAVS